MQVAKWGNSLAVRLPAVVVEALQLKEGDEIEIHVADRRRFGIARKAGRGCGSSIPSGEAAACASVRRNHVPR